MAPNTDARLQAVEMVRGLLRKLTAECEAKGLSQAETLLGSLRGTLDTAARMMDPIVAVEVLRTYLDLIESEIMREPHQ